MQGNYGINTKVWESNKYWIEGFVALQIQPSWSQRLNEFKIKHSSIIKGFACSHNELPTKNRWRLKNAKKTYLKNNPYFDNW